MTNPGSLAFFTA